MQSEYNYLVLSGGAYLGLSQLGCLFYLKKIGLLDNIQEYCGTSVGAIICILLCVGYSPFEIYNFAIEENLLKLGSSFDISSILGNWGIIDLDSLIKKVEDKIVNKIGISPTFLQLYSITKKSIIMCYGDLDQNDMKYPDKDNSPNMLCIDALKFSCFIPLIFQSPTTECNIKGIDGGFGDHFPIQYFMKRRHKGIIGILTKGTISSGSPFPFFDYLLKVLMFSIIQLQNEKFEIPTNNSNLIINIPSDNKNILETITSQTVKRDLFMNGYKVTENKLKKLTKVKID